MKTITLWGVLRDRFGESFELDVRSAREAYSALAHQLPGFKTLTHRIGKVWIIKDGADGSARFTQSDEVDLGGGTGWHFIPYTTGALPIIPILIAAVAVVSTGAAVAGAVTIGTVAALVVSVAMLAYSIYSLVAGKPTQRPTNSKEAALESYGFRDTPALGTEGACVPVILGGPVWIKPTIIGARIRTWNT